MERKNQKTAEIMAATSAIKYHIENQPGA